MAMLEHTVDESKRPSFELEKAITQYLKSLGLKLKTDPRNKYELFFGQKKRK